MRKAGLGEANGGRLPVGAVSIDCDGLVDYARGYGFGYEERENVVLVRGLERMLELLGEAGIGGTIFLIGRDLERAENVELLRRAAEEGHELANHTWSHPRQLTELSRGKQAAEIWRTHRRVAERLGVEMRGFRAPCYDVDERVWRMLEEMGYEYDSSVNPTPVALAMELAVFVKSGLRELELRPSYWRHLRARRGPYVVNGWSRPRRGRQECLPHPEDSLAVAPGGALGRQECLPHPKRLLHPEKSAPAAHRGNGEGHGELVELPLSVWSGARLPVASTWDRLTGMRFFERAVEWLAERGLPLNYHFHAVDLVGFEEDGVDERFGRHPGMRLPLEEKREMVRRALGEFKRRFRLVRLVEMAREARSEW